MLAPPPVVPALYFSTPIMLLLRLLPFKQTPSPTCSTCSTSTPSCLCASLPLIPPCISSVFPIYACNYRYHFRQPWRLSHLQLPFKIALVSSLDVAGVREVAVDANKAADSWFVGYSWSLLVCGGADNDGCDGETHLGWRYSSASGHVFYALIVDYDEQRPTIASVSALPTVVPSSVRFGMPSSASFLL